MSTLSFALRDSATMLRRDVRHSLRNLPMTLSGLLTPIVMLVLFIYVFGGTLGAGLGGVAHGSAYINYVAPAIIIMTVGSGCATTAVNLCTDMNEGIIARFRTMAISRASVLTGLVLGSLIRTMITVGPRHWGRAAHGLPAHRKSVRLDRGARRHCAVHPRGHVDGGGVRSGGQNACGSQ